MQTSWQSSYAVLTLHLRQLFWPSSGPSDGKTTSNYCTCPNNWRGRCLLETVNPCVELSKYIVTSRGHLTWWTRSFNKRLETQRARKTPNCIYIVCIWCLPGWWAMVSGYKFLTFACICGRYLQRGLLQLLFLRCWEGGCFLHTYSAWDQPAAMSSQRLIDCYPAWALIGWCSAFSYTQLVTNFPIPECWEPCSV